MIKSYKIRLIPTEEQEKSLWLHVNAMRFVWNWGLALNMERFQQGEPHLKKESSGKILTTLKNTDGSYQWLNDISVHTISMALIDLDNAYTKFFNIQKKDKKNILKTKSKDLSVKIKN